MRVSELAKALGYKAGELIELAKTAKIAIENVRSEVDGRKAAAIRAHVPHRRDLKGAQLEAYTRVQAEVAAQEAARSAEPKPARKKKEPAAEGDAAAAPAKPKTKRAVAKKEEEAAAPAPAAAAKAPAKPEKPEKKDDKKPKEVVLLSSRDVPAADKPKPAASVHIGLSAEEKAAIKTETEKPLIDVDKVIGQEHEVRVQRAADANALEQGKIAPQEDKAHRHLPPPRVVRPASAPPPRPMPPPPPRMKPRVPPPALRPTVQPPKPAPKPVPMSERKIEITVPITIKDYSLQTGIRIPQIIGRLMSQGVMATINHALGEEQALALALEFKRDVTVKKAERVEDAMLKAAEAKDDPKDLVPRAPIVTFMGHVDHGKTSLLDRIRGTSVAAGEAGGITQHIGASKVLTKDGRPVVFLDTPGHEAFTAMRARGANVTDVAVIVVAADDGVMKQTEEAIAHAKAAGVKIVVALNKCDKPQANANKVKAQLAQAGVQSEDWGGDVVCAEVSALTGTGVDHLVEMLSLEAELMELKANPKRSATGAILEAQKTEDRGIVAKVLVQNGTLKKGDVISAGRAHGRVRSMHDDHGRSVDAAGPATPVEVSGLVDVPGAGQKFNVVDSIDTARQIAENQQKSERDAALQERQQVTLESLFTHIASGKLKDVKVIVKTDVQGSAEVLKQQLAALSTDEVKLKILWCSVGAVNEGDVELAAASQALIIGFNTEPDERVRQLAKERGVDVRTYTVIYQAIEEMKAALEGLLEPEQVEAKTGHLSVKEVFRISRVGAIAGCLCTDGKIERSGQVRLIRGGQVVFTGRIEGLKRFKDDVREVVEGYECGVKLAGHDDIRNGDVIEAYQIQKVSRKLSR